MRPLDLVLQSLRYFWRTHLGVVLGSACATAVLVGALTVGDSVRLSLRDQALQRIGRVDAALTVSERHFRSDLADRMAEAMAGARIAPVLQLPGIAARQGGAVRTGIVEVFGVDARFMALGPAGPAPVPEPGQAFVNERLASQLGVGAGDGILLRVEKPSAMPRDMVLATMDDISFALRVEVGAVLGDEQFGRFGTRVSQVPPFNVFLPLPWLQEQLQLDGRANMLLVGGSGDGVDEANRALRRCWTLADAELRMQGLADGELFELTSERVFLDPPVVAAMTRLLPSAAGVLTYFVNELRHGDRATPYSMVAAVGPLAPGSEPDDAVRAMLGALPDDLDSDEIVLNRWLADDLRAEPGAEVELSYFVMGTRLRLWEAFQRFRVRSVLPMSGLGADPSLVPPFPGITDSENCRDWEPGIPIELDRIRDVDEQYWDEHRGAPKALVALAAGQAAWSNRFGNLTAIRGPRARLAELEQQLLRSLDPASVGLFFQDLRGPALAAGTSTTDFGGLFLGLSSFLIVAALLLTALLFVFGVEQRAREIGTLLAVGFRPARVRRLFLAEALGLALLGGLVGAVLGLGYTQAVLYGLGTLWRDAVGGTALSFHARPGTVVLGVVIAVLAALVAIAWTLRRVFQRPAVELLASRHGIPGRAQPRRSRFAFGVAVGCAILALVLVLVAGPGSAQAAGAFFGAGALLLVAALSTCRLLLSHCAPGTRALHSVGALGMRNAGRRPGRSLATIALLASGTFLVMAVQANRLSPPRETGQRASGTGGFALYGRSTLPVLRDLATPAGRESFGLDEEQLRGVAIVPLRVRDGDDASCLNLSVPQNPRLLGVGPQELAERGAFHFTGSEAPPGGEPPGNPWLLLDGDYGEDVVPAVGDQASITWTMHKRLGDSLEYRDERGRPFRVRIVGAVADSILQGNLVVAERHLRQRFPSTAGYRAFLIDAPPDRVSEVGADMTRAMADIGLEVTTTGERLAAFQAVQNTYLLIFQALGGLGLLLGSIGLGMVVLRNALERRSELAIATAVGFPARAVRRLVWSEHGILLGLGLCSGVLAALGAVVPGARGGPGLPMLLMVAAVTLSGALWVWLASAFATRGPLIEALRSE